MGSGCGWHQVGVDAALACSRPAAAARHAVAAEVVHAWLGLGLELGLGIGLGLGLGLGLGSGLARRR